MSWSNPPQTFRNFAYTELWRSATDAIGNAIRIATTVNNAFIDYLGNAETRYYWVRFVSQANIIGPWNGTAGTSATTSLNPGLLLDSLISSITATELDLTLTSRIDLIDGPTLLTGSVNDRILVEVTARLAALAAEAALRTNADDLLQSQINALSGSTGGDLSGLVTAINQEIANRIAGDLAEANARTLADAAIQNLVTFETSARTAADSTISAALAAAGAVAGQSVAAVIQEKTARIDADGAYASTRDILVAAQAGSAAALSVEREVRASANAASASQITGFAALLGANAASIKSEELARVDLDSALTQRITTISAQTGAMNAAIQVEQSTRTDADGATAQQITALSASSSQGIALIQQESEARVSADVAEAFQRTTLAAKVGDAAAAIALETLVRADSDSAISSQSATVSAAFSANQSAIINEQVSRADADSATAAQTLTIGAATANALGGITVEQQARADADSASAVQINALVATTASSSAAIKTEQNVRVDADTAVAAQTAYLGSAVGQNAAAIFSEQVTRADANSALSSQTLVLGSSVGQSTAALATELVTRATSDSAAANQINSLTANTGAASSAITQEQSARTDSTSALANTFASTTASLGATSAALYSVQTAQATVDSAFAASVNALTSSTANTSSAVFEEQRTRATSDSAASERIAAVTATVGQSTAAITETQQTNADSSSALSRTLAATTATLGSTSAALYTANEALATADGATARQLSGLVVASGGNAASIAQEAQVRTTSAESSAALLSGVSASTGTTSAALRAEQLARTTETSAAATQISQLSASVGSNSAAISTEQSVRASETGDLYAQYTVKLDVNGYVAGFGLASTVNNTGNASSQFGVRADRFYIGSPSQANIIPFVVQTTAGTAANGTSIPAGVYMDAAYIKNATITAAKIGGVYADTITAGYMSTVDLSGSTIVGSSLYIGGTVTYEYNDPARPTQITGIASVASPNVALVGGASGYAEFAVNSFKLKSSAATTATDVFTVFNGNVVLAADRVYATTLSAITANMGTVTAGVVQSTNGQVKFDLNNAYIVWNNNTHMKVVGNGFGQNSDFLEWFGPTQLPATNFAACTTANAYSYVKTSGTVGGLTTGTIAYMRGLRIGDHNGNVILDAGNGTYASAIANSAITVNSGVLTGIGTSDVTVDLSYAPRSANLAQNSDFSVTASPYVLGYNTSGGSSITIERDLGGDEFRPINGHCLGIYRYNTSLTGIVDAGPPIASGISVLPNTRYEASGYVASHRCNAYVLVVFWDSAGAYISEVAVGYSNGRYPGGNNLADWGRPFAFFVTPSNARTVTLILRTLDVDVGTNLNLYSSDMSKWTVVGGMTVSTNTVIGPFNTLTADTVSNTPSTLSTLTRSITYSASTTYTRSFYATAVSGTGVIVSRAANTGTTPVTTNASFNLLTGIATLVTGTPATCSMTSIANGWYRCVHTFTTSATPPTNVQLVIGANGATATATTIAIEGIQTEAAATPGTFIFTQSTAVSTGLDAPSGYAWATRLFFGPANTNQAAPSEWFAGSVGNVAQLGYTGDLAATKNTVTRSASDPTLTSTAVSDGDIWIDTDASPSQLVYVRAGGAWQISANYLSAGTQLTDYSALSNANITLNSDGSLAQAGGGTVAPFEPYHAAMWDFRGVVTPWISSNATLSSVGDALVVTGTLNTGPNFRIVNGGISVNGSLFSKVRVKYRRTSGTGAWFGNCYYTTAAHPGFVSGYRKAISAPATPLVNGEWYISEWDMASLTEGGTDWVTSTITGIRFDLTSTASEVWEIDWVIIGRYGAGEWTSNTLNPSNPLTAANIGTYIQNLAVGTLHIAGGAVTVPSSAVVSTTQSLLGTATWKDLCTVTVTIPTTGLAGVDTAIPILITWAVECAAQVSGAQVRQWRIIKDATTVIYTSSASILDVQNFISGVVKGTQDAGAAVTWTLQGKGVASLPIYQTSMWATAARR